MNIHPHSRLMLTGVSAVFFLTLVFPVDAEAERSHASSLRPEPITNQTRAPRKDANTIQLEETLVSGNQELPKVLYILPWQPPDGIPEIAMDSESPELDVFRRLYPPAYRRELNYHERLQAAGTEK